MAAQIKESNTPQEDIHGPAAEAENVNRTGTRPRGPAKPIVLSSQRYNKILNNATTGDKTKAKEQHDEEQRRREQLKKGNDELVAQFKGSMQRTQEEKMQQIKDQLEKKTQQAKDAYELTKENEAQKRREKIAKAQQLIEKLKPGPRDLHTAALQSEVLRARNVQRDINEEFKKAIKKQEAESKVMCHGQAMSWIHEEQQRLMDKQKNANLYKQELLQSINENQKQRTEQRKQQIKEQQAAREATDSEIKAQIEKEMSIMEKKRATLRKNALEAMKMVEQRRLRDHMSDQVEDRLCCVYNAGKNQLEALRAEQTKKLAADHQKKIEDEVKRLSAIEDKTQVIEAERIRRDISTMQLKFTAEEQEKVRKDKAAKQARIEAYMKEMQEHKEAQRRANEEKRFDIAQRLKNAEVNHHFVERDRKEQLANARDMRLFLNQQMEETQRNRLAEKQANVTCHAAVVAREDKFFFEYARNLMEDAQQKGRPLYPFVKAVQQYKKENEIDCERKIPRHMETYITIGRALPAPDKAAEKEKPKDDQTATQDDILKNCLKITEIIGKAGKDQQRKDENTVQSSNQMVGDVENSAAKDQAVEIEPSKVESATVHMEKLRYSMQDLKKMNQFAAPSCH